MSEDFELSIRTQIVGRGERSVRAEARTPGNHVLHGGYICSVGRSLTNTNAAEATAEAIAEATAMMRRWFEIGRRPYDPAAIADADLAAFDVDYVERDEEAPGARLG
jgi:hypothetical protein